MKRTPAPSLAVPGVPSKLLHSTSEQGLSPKRCLKGCKGKECSMFISETPAHINEATEPLPPPELFISTSAIAPARYLPPHHPWPAEAFWPQILMQCVVRDLIWKGGGSFPQTSWGLCQLWIMTSRIFLPRIRMKFPRCSEFKGQKRWDEQPWILQKSTNLPPESVNGLRNPNNLNRLDPQFSFELLITKWQCVLGALHGTSGKKVADVAWLKLCNLDFGGMRSTDKHLLHHGNQQD